MSNEQQVRVVYADYAVHWADAYRLPADERRRFLSQWTTDPLLTGILEGVVEDEEKNHRIEGRPVPHVFAVEVYDEVAQIDDCSDDSKAVIRNTRTGKIVDDGTPRRNWYVATLQKTASGWRIAGTEIKKKSCVGR